MSDEGIADRIRARTAETGADIFILPEHVHEQTGTGVYAQDTLFLVKRLRREGINAEYLDASADRYFVTQRSALLIPREHDRNRHSDQRRVGRDQKGCFARAWQGQWHPDGST